MSSQLSPEEAAAAAAAAAEAFHQFSIEIWTLYSFALASTLLRTYARLRAAGLSGLRAEDLFVWLGIVSFLWRLGGRKRKEFGHFDANKREFCRSFTQARQVLRTTSRTLLGEWPTMV